MSRPRPPMPPVIQYTPFLESALLDQGAIMVVEWQYAQRFLAQRAQLLIEQRLKFCPSLAGVRIPKVDLCRVRWGAAPSTSHGKTGRRFAAAAGTAPSLPGAAKGWSRRPRDDVMLQGPGLFFGYGAAQHRHAGAMHALRVVADQGMPVE